MNSAGLKYSPMLDLMVLWWRSRENSLRKMNCGF